MKKFLSCVLMLCICLNTVTVEASPKIRISPQYINMVVSVCNRYEDVDPFLVLAVIEKESNGRASCVSSAGAVGLMQILPKYHKARMRKLGVKSLTNPKNNVLVGIDFLDSLYRKYKDWYKVLMFYNSGYVGLRKAERGEYSKYAVDVFTRYQELSDYYFIGVKE